MLNLEVLIGLREVAGAPFGTDLLAFSHAVRRVERSFVYVARDERIANVAADFLEFCAPDIEVNLLPAWDSLPYDRISPSPSLAARRCRSLASLANAQAKHTRSVLIVTASAIVQRIPPLKIFEKASSVVEQGDYISRDDVTEFLSYNGYTRVSSVRDKGDYAIRGGILDLFPPTQDEPIRLDFFGDTLETIRLFDPETQRTTGKLKSVSLVPVSEILFNDETLRQFREKYLETFGPPAGDPIYEAARNEIRSQGLENWLPLFYDDLATLFDYVGVDAVFALGPLALESIRERQKLIQDHYEARLEAASESYKPRVLPPERLYIQEKELFNRLNSCNSCRFSEGEPHDDGYSLNATLGRNFSPERNRPDVNLFDAARDHINALRSRKRPVVIAAWTEGSVNRLQSVLAEHGLKDIETSATLREAKKAGLSIARLPLETGFVQDDLAVISETDLLGDRLSAPRRKRKAANYITDAVALEKGDLIVHVDHGVGRYEGLKIVQVAGGAHDCLELTYAGNDRIFLPVQNIDLISRYGSEHAERPLDKLGGASWQGRKARAKENILAMAEELLAVAAARELKPGYRVNSGDGLYEEFAAGFSFEETDDQLNAIEDVLSDLSSGKSMDRLICGDVGFGKTEVAFRAAFLIAMSGMQVALLAPTTLLVRQHYKTLKERIAGWPIQVRQLSRLISPNEAAKTKYDLKEGTVDIVVGTHALLGKAIDFKRLGLLIVDEEQRFGVRHKERLKELKSDVHVLTLSATPIPRTLQMALTGIRDLSIIATPPVDRLAVRTYVSSFDPVTIREALLREKYRGGQAFFVAPRISDLEKVRDFLKDNVQEISFVIAHGQMGATELEDIMEAFYDGKFDVLLSTTIVESGLDIPRANTLIVYRADRFGLSQLYQLRGRVGRWKLRAYAYFTTPHNQIPSEAATKRLRVLKILDSLGAGFQLASHDLDLRGGGNLLGVKQSGQVREVGVELYQSMLEEAVISLKSKGVEKELPQAWSPQISFGISVFIPDDYVGDLTERLTLYRRLGNAESDEDIESFAAELIDRFGNLPIETKQLLEISSLKPLCKNLGIEKLDANAGRAIFSFREDTKLDPNYLMKVIQSKRNTLKIRPDSKLVYTDLGDNPNARITSVKKLLRLLADKTLLTNKPFL